jgi:hypothetical protein
MVQDLLPAKLSRSITVEWLSDSPKGEVEVKDGVLLNIEVVNGKGRADGTQFASEADGPFKLKLIVEGSPKRYEIGATLVYVRTEKQPFTFFLRDVDALFPIWIPEYRVIVTTADDQRTSEQIVSLTAGHGGESRLQQFEREPEESFESAAAQVRQMSCHTWLGVSRNMRIFAIGEKLDWIEPRFHYFPALIPESEQKRFRYEFVMGRGWGPCDVLRRSLEDGVLPILRGSMEDGDIQYDLTTFATLQSKRLTAENLQGTDYLIADGYAKQHMFTLEQQARFDSLLPSELESGEETALSLRIVAKNTAAVPRYAYLRTIWPSKGLGEGSALPWRIEANTGFGLYESGRVFAISRFNSEPLHQPEVTILLQPGESATLDILLPHRPLAREQAEQLASPSFDQLLSDCKRFWEAKLQSAATVDLPEQRITEMIRAGILHMDLISYGSEPNGAMAATIGDYPPLGSESSPIIQFFDSMGLHDIARRSLEYFFEKQHDDGFIQNFNNYMIETGPVLWSVGEHFRYTGDEAWIRTMLPKIRKSCEFLKRWRERNQVEPLRGKGYGMLGGKTADPEDPFRSFMLNGYAYLGFSRIAEVFEELGLEDANVWREGAEGLKSDIQRAFYDALSVAPVVPLGNGSWCPTCAPWVESTGALTLHVEGGDWHTHGSMVARDSLLGPLYLPYQEIIDPQDPVVSFLLNFHAELMTERNVVFSQPYYSRHPWVHLMRREPKLFLKAYYNTMASLCDRETYTFWEHYFRASAHKAHEEAWFLMETRWMLYMERGEELHLLAGVPRDYLRNGQTIQLRNVKSYFGPLSLRIVSRVEDGVIEAEIQCDSPKRPRAIQIRLPHPDGIKAKAAEGGSYDPHFETVTVNIFKGTAKVRLRFN